MGHTSTNNNKINEEFRHQLDNLGKNPASEAEVAKLGLVKYMKKYRQYAQFSYRDYKIPKAPQGISISCTRDVIYTKMEEDNLYAQVVVRFHTKQILAVYDRFGRLMYGNADISRNVLENVVFERHLSDNEGQWRIHAKLPSEAYEREPLKKTVATIKKQPIRSEQEQWHEQEKEVHPEIYYPDREWLIKENEREKLVNKSTRMYWRKKRKAQALQKMGYGLTRMRRKARRLTDKKKQKIDELRKMGKLPQPPKNFED